jgi:hypothetical protein
MTLFEFLEQFMALVTERRRADDNKTEIILKVCFGDGRQNII